MTDTTEARRALLSLLLDRVEREALLPAEAPLLRPLVAADQAAADTEWAHTERAEADVNFNADRAHEQRTRAEQAEAAIARVRALADRWGNALAIDLTYARALRDALDGPSPTPDDAPATPVLDALRTGQPVELLFCSPLVNAHCPGHDAPPYCDRAPSNPITPAATPDWDAPAGATVTDWAASVDEQCPAHYKGDPPLLSQPVWQSVDYRCERRGHGLDTDHAVRQGGDLVFCWADAIAVYPTSDTTTTGDDAPSEPQQ